jgi:hypothetical protein
MNSDNFSTAHFSCDIDDCLQVMNIFIYFLKIVFFLLDIYK